VPNQSETAFYTSIHPTDETSAVAAVRKLREKGVRYVVITMGKEGSFFADGEVTCRVEAYPAEPVDTTAAGDTYVGAFVTCLSEGKSVEEAMFFAGKAAAVTVTRRGAQKAIPTRAEVDAF